MKKVSVFAVLLLLVALPLVQPRHAHGQTTQNQTRLPIQVGPGYLESQGATMQFGRTNKMTPSGKAALQQQRIISVRNFTNSFTYQGTVFPYTMVGNDPTRGGTSFLDTQLIPISFFFDQFVDQNGNNIVIDVNPIIPSFLNSPNFQPSNYTSGFTQFGDAVQRATFFNVARPGWRNLLEQPQRFPSILVEVPPGDALVFQNQAGTIFALIDINFMVSQLNTIVQLEPLRATALTIALTRNAFFYQGTPNNCCELGFHTAFETGTVGPFIQVQTFAFATWPDPGIFVEPDIADVFPVSHEISEWMNDPFISNVVPPWESPDGSGACGFLLETGDPIENLPNPSFPVTINGVTYHPQTEALLPWFSRPATNTMSIGGAFSYPDTTKLPTASVPCPNP